MCTSFGENRKPDGGVHESGALVGELHLRQVGVSVISALIDDHRQHPGHSVAADQFDAGVTVGMVEAGRVYTHTVVLLHSE